MKAAVFGSTGFVGNYLVSELLVSGYEVNVLIRSGSESKLEHVDKCTVFNGNIDDEDIVEQMIKDSEVVIYNIGIIREFESKNITYEKLHFEGAKLTIDLAEKYNIKRYVLMSANGVCPNGTEYQTSKYKSEIYLKSKIRDWTIIRPSLIFGDSKGKKEFCSELKKNMLSLPFPAPLFFSGINIFSAGKFKMSPVHVKDVARIFVSCINNNHAFKKVYELGGDDFNWKQIIKIIASAYNRNKLTIPAPAAIIGIIALFLDRFEWFPISRDQIIMLLKGNTCESDNLFKRYNIEPIKFEISHLDYL
jgi:NADH dehydrogenase